MANTLAHHSSDKKSSHGHSSSSKSKSSNSSKSKTKDKKSSSSSSGGSGGSGGDISRHKAKKTLRDDKAAGPLSGRTGIDQFVHESAWDAPWSAVGAGSGRR